MQHIHFIGIGGTGLSAIARVLLEKGFTVSGSDRVASDLFNEVTKAGAKTFLNHAPEHIKGADVVIRSSAIPDENIEVQTARKKGIPVLKRSDFLEFLIGKHKTLAVAGTHGKTTTTAMLIWVLTELGFDPSFIVGGLVNQIGRNARAGQGKLFVIEADEYDYMFLGLSPLYAIITNIEHDHPDCFPTPGLYYQAFKDFLGRLLPNGIGFLCFEDPQTRRLLDEMKDSGRTLMSYGFTGQADYQAVDITTKNGLPQFTFRYPSAGSGEKTAERVCLAIPGDHNVLNATAALGVIHQAGLNLHEAIHALSDFTGTGRRFEIVGEFNGAVIIDDYGHHPTEIAATLQAAHSLYPMRRIWAIWQPHTYSRTSQLETAFIQALSQADQVIVLKIYAAREKDPGYSAETIAIALPDQKGAYFETFEDAINHLRSHLTAGDAVIVFSAGDATAISQALVQAHETNKI